MKKEKGIKTSKKRIGGATFFSNVNEGDLYYGTLPNEFYEKNSDPDPDIEIKTKQSRSSASELKRSRLSLGLGSTTKHNFLETSDPTFRASSLKRVPKTTIAELEQLAQGNRFDILKGFIEDENPLEYIFDENGTKKENYTRIKYLLGKKDVSGNIILPSDKRDIQDPFNFKFIEKGDVIMIGQTEENQRPYSRKNICEGKDPTTIKFPEVTDRKDLTYQTRLWANCYKQFAMEKANELHKSQEFKDLLLKLMPNDDYIRLFNATIYNKIPDLLKLLKVPGININYKYEFGLTPLHLAILNNHDAYVEKLLAAPGINVNARTDKGETPLILATLIGNTVCLKKLLDAPGVDVNIEYDDSKTSLHIAVEKGYILCVKALLAAPEINVNARDDNRRTPLYIAAYNRQYICLKLLLAAPRVDVNARDKDKITPLHVAVESAYIICVKMLLAAPGVEVNAKDDEDWTPLHIAAQRGHTECVQALLAAPGVEVNAKARLKLTPLHLAAIRGNDMCVRALLAAPGVEVNAENISKETPLYTAVEFGHIYVVRLLLAAPGVDVNAKTISKETPLFLAAEKGYAACVQALLAAPGVDVNAKRGSATPLYIAAYYGKDICLELLLTSPEVDVNAITRDGETPLMVAAAHNYILCVQALLADRRVDANIKDKLKRTALDKAIRYDGGILINQTEINNKKNIVKLLLSATDKTKIKNINIKKINYIPIKEMIIEYKKIIKNELANVKASNIIKKFKNIIPTKEKKKGGKVNRKESDYTTYNGKKYILRTDVKDKKYILVGMDKKRVYIF